MSYLVRIKVASLNIRQKASFTSKIVGTVKKGGVYTIVNECNGLGKLKSGVGWISLGTTYVERISNNTVSTPNYVYDLGKCVITNYYANDELGSGSKGALGTKLVPNYSCASHNLPYGTKVYIAGLKGKVNSDGIFEVHDTRRNGN